MDMSEHGLDLFLDPAPPNLGEAFGYQGDRRWVAFFWSRENDIFFSYDGTHINTISYIAWSGLLEHPYTVLLQHRHKVSFEFGDFYNEARHWLLLDRELQRLYAGRRDQVLKHLREIESPTMRQPAGALPRWSLNPIAGELHQVECMARWLDEKYQERVDGLPPDQPLHASWADVNPIQYRSSR